MNNQKLYIKTTGPPLIKRCIIILVIALVLILGTCGFLQTVILSESNPEKQLVIIENAKLWLGDFGIIGICILFAILIFVIYAVLVVVHYSKFLVQDAKKFFYMINALLTSLVTKFTKYGSVADMFAAAKN